MAERIWVNLEAKNVIDAALARLSEHMIPGEFHYLTDVRTLIKGAAYSRDETMPLLALVPTTATPEPTARQSQFHANFQLTLRMRAVVDHDDPEIGGELARDLAGRAMHAILIDPQTNAPASLMSPDGLIRYQLNFGQFDLTASPGRAPNLYESRSGVVALMEATY